MPFLRSITSTRICLTVVLAVVLSEAAVHGFRSIPGPETGGAVYSWNARGNAVPVEDHNTGIARSQYHPDRGGQWKIARGDGKNVTVYYFEWDRLETAPTMVLDGHHAELCNESAGFKLMERLPDEGLEGPGGERVVFDATRYADPAGRMVYVYKNVWLTNTGNWNLRHKSRWQRLRLPFVKRRDAARVFMGGVYGAVNSREAWEIFSREVLAGVTWENSK